MVGNRIRVARQSRNLSLTELAGRADISAATLSRIERDKQNLDLGLFLTLTSILKLTPHEVLGDSNGEEGVDPLVRTITGMETGDRAQLWRSLAAERKAHRRKSDNKAVANEVDELLAQVDFIRGEIESVQKRLRRR
ncbi:MAG: helix-turn-helix transcriptional regulator [Acidobacteria bacterium]|nr:helix-turn-helix transcriptional regulator [Acidobacteriota bacterium]MBV9071066.1 helix-turn-helix transcriptional regulator [Acidobacteriota bacterium]